MSFVQDCECPLFYQISVSSYVWLWTQHGERLKGKKEEKKKIIAKEYA
jgi:hypothetical protein